ncbi:MAG: response regulator transcription factor [Chloroflexi bacterium]|nr:response regulator transcription factor [Chloroflexota bacterium]
MGKRISILVVDDHTAVREGLKAVLVLQPDMEVVGEASDGAEAIAETARLQPNIVILDVLMKPMGGIDACRVIKSRWPSIKVLIMSELKQASIIRRAVVAGADGYLSKEVNMELVCQALRTLHAGGMVLPGDMGSRLVGEGEP